MVLWSHLTLDLDVATRLRSVWALHATGGLSKELVIQLLQSGDEYIRAWVIQLELEDRRVSPTVLKKLAEMARNDPSPVVRLYLAAALQRLPIEQRWPIAERLVQRGEDADDHNIPLMIWYGIEPAVAVDPVSAAKLITKTKIPQLRQFIARRMAAK